LLISCAKEGQMQSSGLKTLRQYSQNRLTFPLCCHRILKASLISENREASEVSFLVGAWSIYKCKKLIQIKAKSPNQEPHGDVSNVFALVIKLNRSAKRRVSTYRRSLCWMKFKVLAPSRLKKKKKKKKIKRRPEIFRPEKIYASKTLDWKEKD